VGAHAIGAAGGVQDKYDLERLLGDVGAHHRVDQPGGELHHGKYSVNLFVATVRLGR